MAQQQIVRFQTKLDDLRISQDICYLRMTDLARALTIYGHRANLLNFKSILISVKSDIDECSAESRPCDENADCTNTDGSYSCTCKQGFTGNGTICEGKDKDDQYITMAVVCPYDLKIEQTQKHQYGETPSY